MKVYNQKKENNKTKILTFQNTSLNKMSMTFVFDEEKLKKDNVEIHPLSRMRNYFNSFQIKETTVGTFEGTDANFTQFASRVFHMPDYPWFMDYIKEWYWDARDGREDVLKGIEKAKNPDNYPNLTFQKIKL